MGVGSYPTVSVSRLTIANGSTNGSGGGIEFTSGVLHVTDCAFTGNRAQSGGTIFNEFGTLTATGSALSGDAASANGSAHGGAIANDNGTSMTVANSTFYGNSVSGSLTQGGGAIMAKSFDALVVNNSVFVGNLSSPGIGASIANLASGSSVTSGSVNGNNNIYYENLNSKTEDGCNSCNSGGPDSNGSFDAGSNPVATPLAFDPGSHSNLGMHLCYFRVSCRCGSNVADKR